MLRLRYFALIGAVCLWGCEKQPPPVELMDVKLHDQLRSEFVMPSEPESVVTLHELYERLADDSDTDQETDSDAGDPDAEIVVIGRVGGLDEPDNPNDPKARWSRNLAEFRLLDPAGDGAGDEDALADHHHEDPDHECPFCASEGPGIQTIVRFIDKEGNVVPVDSRVLFRLDGNDLVVVRGKARLEPGSIVIEGTGLHVRR